MTKLERHTFILEELLKQGSLLVSELAERLDVSSVTIRKDLTELERAGKLYRSHGKAILINPFANNRSVNEKEGLNAEEKKYYSCFGTQSAYDRQANGGLGITASH